MTRLMILALFASISVALEAHAQPQDPAWQQDVVRQGLNDQVRMLQAGNVLLWDQSHQEPATFLGVGGSEAPPVVRQQLKLPKGIGIVIDHIEKGSPAEAAGLKQYDVLTKLDDQWLVSIEQLAVLVRMHKNGEEVRLTVIRESQPRIIAARLVQKQFGTAIERRELNLAPMQLQNLTDVARFNAIDLSGAQLTTQPFAIEVKDYLRDLAAPDQGAWKTLYLDTTRPTTQPYSVTLNYVARVAPEQKAFVTFTPLPASTHEYNWSDDRNTLTLKVSIAEGGRRQISLVAKDSSGKVLFDGPIDTDEQRNALPKGIAEKLPAAMAKALLESN